MPGLHSVAVGLHPRYFVVRLGLLTATNGLVFFVGIVNVGFSMFVEPHLIRIQSEVS